MVSSTGSKLRNILASFHLLKRKKKNTIFRNLGPKQTTFTSKIIIPKTIQYIKFVVAVYFYYDEDLVLLFLGLFRQKNSLYVGRTPPWATVTPARSLFNFSSFRTDSFNCRDIILFLLLSHAAFFVANYAIWCCLVQTTWYDYWYKMQLVAYLKVDLDSLKDKNEKKTNKQTKRSIIFNSYDTILIKMWK